MTFANEADYNKVQEDDSIDFVDLTSFAPEKPLTLEFKHKDGTKDAIKVNHTYNAGQIEWFKAGSALNLMAAKIKAAQNGSAKKQVAGNSGLKPVAKKVAKKAKKAAKKNPAKKAVKKIGKKSAKKSAKKVAKKKGRR